MSSCFIVRLQDRVALDAERSVKVRLSQFETKPVDWRWEVMEDCVVDELSMYDHYRAHFKEEVLRRDTALNVTVKQGLEDEMHKFISLVLRLASKGAGRSSSL